MRGAHFAGEQVGMRWVFGWLHLCRLELYASTGSRVQVRGELGEQNERLSAGPDILSFTSNICTGAASI